MILYNPQCATGCLVYELCSLKPPFESNNIFNLGEESWRFASLHYYFFLYDDINHDAGMNEYMNEWFNDLYI